MPQPSTKRGATPNHQSDLARGKRFRKKLNGRRYGTTNTLLPEMAPDLEEMVNEILFGRVWSRKGLNLRMRSIAVISALTARQQLPQLRTYIANGLNVGLQRKEIIETLMQLVFYVGLPAVSNALMVAREVFREELGDR